MAGSFYDALTPMTGIGSAFDAHHYAPAPGDWLLAASDIKGSTAAVAAGRHSAVNFSAAASIAALVNLCGAIPFQFNGDGAVALVPPEHGDAARRELARVRGFTRRELGLELRVGLVPVAALAERGARVLVGRYEPSEGNAFAAFLGGGVDLTERSIKGRGDEDVRRLAAIDESLDDGRAPDLTGLSCRWAPIKAQHGRMVSLVVRGGDHGELHAALSRLSGVGALKAATLAALDVRWPPKGLMFEARARRGRGPLALSVAALLAETLLAYLVIRFGVRVGRFDPERYRGEILANLVDFSRADDSLCLVFDCPVERLDQVRAYLDERVRHGDLTYGLHVADHAVMTCFVSSLDEGRHVHFADGGDGGYTQAATQLKAKLATPVAAG